MRVGSGLSNRGRTGREGQMAGGPQKLSSRMSLEERQPKRGKIECVAL